MIAAFCELTGCDEKDKLKFHLKTPGIGEGNDYQCFEWPSERDAVVSDPVF